MVRRGAWIAAVAATVVAGGACGKEPGQTAGEPSGTWHVEIADVSIPDTQPVAKSQEFVIAVRNADERTVPNLSVTIDGLNYREDMPGLADPLRPVWVLNSPPAGSVSAYNNTYTVGPVEPGQTATLRWSVTPMRTGTYDLTYEVAAGPAGDSKAIDASGDVPGATIKRSIVSKPSFTPVGEPDATPVTLASASSGG